jgi:hypothetical protein
MAASVVSMTVPASAGEIAEKAAEAETLLQAGNAAAGFEALNAAVDAYWGAAPLTLRQVYFAGPASTGLAAKRPDGPFLPGEAARIYLEPLGYALAEANGTYTISLDTGIEIRTPGGIILAKAENFGHLEWKGTVKNRSFNGRIRIELPALKPGDYELILTVDDPAGGKTASATLPFTMAAN